MCADPSTLRYIFTAGVVTFAFSLIDLTPDFIPMLGLLDDMILVPLGIFIAIKLVPKDVFDECHVQAEVMERSEKPVNRHATLIIISIWLSLGILEVLLMYRLLTQ